MYVLYVCMYVRRDGESEDKGHNAANVNVFYIQERRRGRQRKKW